MNDLAHLTVNDSGGISLRIKHRIHHTRITAAFLVTLIRRLEERKNQLCHRANVRLCAYRCSDCLDAGAWQKTTRSHSSILHSALDRVAGSALLSWTCVVVVDLLRNLLAVTCCYHLQTDALYQSPWGTMLQWWEKERSLDQLELHPRKRVRCTQLQRVVREITQGHVEILSLYREISKSSKAVLGTCAGHPVQTRVSAMIFSNLDAWIRQWFNSTPWKEYRLLIHEHLPGNLDFMNLAWKRFFVHSRMRWLIRSLLPNEWLGGNQLSLFEILIWVPRLMANLEHFWKEIYRRWRLVQRWNNRVGINLKQGLQRLTVVCRVHSRLCSVLSSDQCPTSIWPTRRWQTDQVDIMHQHPSIKLSRVQSTRLK